MAEWPVKPGCYHVELFKMVWVCFSFKRTCSICSTVLTNSMRRFRLEFGNQSLLQVYCRWFLYLMHCWLNVFIGHGVHALSYIPMATTKGLQTLSNDHVQFLIHQTLVEPRGKPGRVSGTSVCGFMVLLFLVPLCRLHNNIVDSPAWTLPSNSGSRKLCHSSFSSNCSWIPPFFQWHPAW